MTGRTNERIFTELLLQWHFEENNRVLPWKQEQDAYKIWLSEVILQQTRADQALPYYERFTAKYPNVHLLANASEDEVFRLWQGLGYYNRCRNLLHTARMISREYDGRFPDTYEQILALKGIGGYTAAAIASFAFGLPYAVLDGNVYRVLSRYFGIDTPIDSPAGKQEFQALATRLLPAGQPAAFNQAIMDFGASVCSPKAPACTACPLAQDCFARNKDMVSQLPVKAKKLKIKERHLHYLVLHTGQEVYLQQRKAKDIWQNLYEFLLIESPLPYTETETWAMLQPYHPAPAESVFRNRQRLTHQLIVSDFYLISVDAKPGHLTNGLWVPNEHLKNYAFPKTILSFFNRKKYF
ncbi:A/G-specific adenine glycosylase [Taibaiella koreensis]|uniref:A/G-specific adenine glycosylase n=1 Tax=Taibaiella koreensis TaxID=1268548 RepID=UPI000E59B863|nr:A/G-specific adenine glycosylase [Taibaiella koreensis]